MQLSTIYTQRLEEVTQKGIEIGEQRGKELTQREIATNLRDRALAYWALASCCLLFRFSG